MKRTTLVFAILSMFFLPIYSQVNSLIRLNSAVEGVTVYETQNPFYTPKAFDFSSLLNDSLYNKKIFIPKIPDKQLFFARIPFREPNACHCNHNFINIPIIRPVGVFSPMINYNSDQRDRYTLLITN